MKIEKVPQVTKYVVEMSEFELATIYKLIDKKVNSGEACDSTQFDIYNALYPLFTEPVTPMPQIDILAEYLMKFFPEAIVEGGAADSAINIMEKLRIPFSENCCSGGNPMMEDLSKRESYTNTTRKKSPTISFRK